MYEGKEIPKEYLEKKTKSLKDIIKRLESNINSQ